MDREKHWENIYTTKKTTEVSWFRPHLDKSLEIIDSIGLKEDASIIDVGCGASTLIDDLLDRGFTNLTCLDISAAALEPTKKRVRERLANVN